MQDDTGICRGRPRSFLSNGLNLEVPDPRQGAMPRGEAQMGKESDVMRE
jgi:hypothetical protein